MSLAAQSDAIGETIERWCAHWAAVPAFLGLWLVGMAAIGIEATNIAISVATVLLLLLTVGRDRRDRAALHAKLDELLIDLPDADERVARIEERTEDEIEETRP